MALKFKGRTQSRGTIELKGIGSRPNKVQAMAWRLVLAALALSLLVTLAHDRIGNTVIAPPGGALQLTLIEPFQRYRPTATIENVPVGRAATFGAAWVFLEKWAQELDPQIIGSRGLTWLLVLVAIGVAVWLLLAHFGEWRKPSVPFSVLLALQLFAGAYYFSSFRAPAQKLNTLYTAFDFHAHTTRSNGLLTPQQQIDWHRARGFGGLAFTDSDSLMPADELTKLRLANPDMLLVNGSEYHGSDVHILFFGLRKPISSHELDVREAIRSANHQNAIAIVAHPWYPAKYTPEELIDMGVDGFEGWNGIVWSSEIADLVRDKQLIGTTGTDTISKSGPHCFTWTLLPRGLRNEGDVLRSLRMRKVAVASTLGDNDTPAGFDARRARSRSPMVLLSSAHAAWRQLSLAQRINTVLGLVAALALLWLWGSGARNSSSVSAPSRVVGFLRKRRLPARVLGVLLMVLAFAGSIAAALVTMGTHFKGSMATLSPLYAILAWVLLDLLYLYGRGLWRRKQ